jgi:hypothetical protein
MTEDFGSSEAGKKGGKARAAKLTKEQRHEIARQAAAARWHGIDLESIPKAICEGAIDFAGISVPCAVLADGTRVLSERGVTKGFSLKRAGSNWQRSKDETGARLPIFASANNINSFMDADLRLALSQPLLYRPLNAKGAIAYGTKAELIPKVGDAWLKARDAGELTEPQKKVAKVIDLVMRGFAIVGIVALVDEATGYERFKQSNDLAKILEAFVAKELQKWLPTFDLEFYELICQVRNEPLSRVEARPPYFGKLTNNLVYQRLAPGVLQKLRELNPVVESGRRKHKHFQYLTPDMGHPKLKEHLAAVMQAMKFAKAMGVDWEQFLKTLDKTLPKYQPMPLLNGVQDQHGKALEG